MVQKQMLLAGHPNNQIAKHHTTGELGLGLGLLSNSGVSRKANPMVCLKKLKKSTPI